MKLFTAVSCFLLLNLLLVTSCTKTETNYFPENQKNLIIISDNEASSDMVVGIMGAVEAAYPGIKVQYFSSKMFDVMQGSYMMYLVMTSYPAGTYIAGIIEPGTSSKRIVYQAGGEFILSPDNMLSTRILKYYPASQCYFVENPQVIGGAEPGTLSTGEFYKRAILSMLAGTPLSSFGPLCAFPQKFPVQDPVLSGDTIKGEVLFIDNFGNCMTNIPQGLVSNIPPGTLLDLECDTSRLTITMGVNYSSVPVGGNVCFVTGSQRLQFAINYGNFSEKYHAVAGSKVWLRKF